VDLSPLVSIDLVLTREDGSALLGRRTNKPAQGFWFVPGGRILKNERLQDALERIVRRELGPNVPTTGWRWLGAYEHFYDDNFAGADGVSTHYVVLAVSRTVTGSEAEIVMDEQHDELCWMAPEALLARSDVHANSRAYFDPACAGFCA